jgi:hypothetical protein
MFTTHEDHFAGRSSRAGRPFRLAAAALAAAGLIVLAPAAARANLVVVHSAKSGTLAGDQLTLHGVGHRATWTTNSGRSGVVSIARMHRRLFLSGTPWATGTLHIAGQRGGQELALRLRRPRYNRARQTVRYRVKRLSKRRSARASGIRPRRRFGAASLSIVGAKLVGDNGGNDCSVTIENNTPWPLEASAEGKWPTDTWDPGIGFQAVLAQGDSTEWGSDGGLWRGCSVSGSWTVISDPDAPPNPPQGTFNLNTTWLWNGGGDSGTTCSPTTGSYYCQDLSSGAAGTGSWELNYIYPSTGR